MGYREREISNHAVHIISSYSNTEGIRLFYKLKGVKTQNFTEHAPSYYQWLLAAVPAGYRAEVNIKVQEMRADLKTIARSLIIESMEHKEVSVPAIDEKGPTLFATAEDLDRIEIEKEELLRGAQLHEYELVTGRKQDEVVTPLRKIASEGTSLE